MGKDTSKGIIKSFISRGNKAGRGNRLSPNDSARPDNARPMGGHFQEKVTEDNLLWLMQRDSFAFRIIEGVTGDVWSQIPEFESENEAFKESVETFLDRIGYYKAGKAAYRWSRLYGLGMLYIEFEELLTGDDDQLAYEPANPRSIKRLTPFSAKQINKQKGTEGFEYDTEIGSSTYGDLTHVWLRTEVGDMREKTTKVHMSRILMINPLCIDGNPHGMSVLMSIFDDLYIKKNTDLSLGDFLYRSAGGVAHWQVPNSVPDAMFDEMSDDMYLDFRNDFVTREGIKLDWKFPTGTLNPEPYVDYLKQKIAAGSMIPDAVITGVRAGSLAGSEVNAEQYANLIESEQTNTIEEMILRPLIALGQELKEVVEGEYTIAFPSLVDVSDKDNAEVAKTYSDAVRGNAFAIKMLKETGIPFKVENERIVILDTDVGGAEVLPGAEPMLQLPEAPIGNARANKRDLSETTALTKEWGLPLGKVENQMMQATLAWMDKEDDKVAALIEDVGAEETQDGVQEASATAPWDGIPVEAMNVQRGNIIDEAAIAKVLAFKFGEQALAKALAPFIKQAYEIGMAETVGRPEITTMPDVTTAAGYIENNGLLAAKSYSDTTLKALQQELVTGIRNGEGVSKLTKRVSPIIDDANKRAATLARTESNRAANGARLEAYKQNGLQYYQYLATLDDITCVECVSYDGKVLSIEENAALLPVHPNCRCTTLPYRGEGE